MIDICECQLDTTLLATAWQGKAVGDDTIAGTREGQVLAENDKRTS